MTQPIFVPFVPAWPVAAAFAMAEPKKSVAGTSKIPHLCRNSDTLSMDQCANRAERW